MKRTEMKIGVCETCKNYYEERYDPSPAGVSLGAGYMIDAGCGKEEELPDDSPDVGMNMDNQCPVWELAPLTYCPKHKYWYWGECSDCMNDYYEEDKKYEHTQRD